MCRLEYTNAKDDLLEYICLCCNKNHQKKFDKNFKKIFANTYTFSNHDLNEFILLLPKGVNPYYYVNDQEKFNETLPQKEDFYSHLTMEVITNVDYIYTKRVCKDYEKSSLGDYHDLYVRYIFLR